MSRFGLMRANRICGMDTSSAGIHWSEQAWILELRTFTRTRYGWRKPSGLDWNLAALVRPIRTPAQSEMPELILNGYPLLIRYKGVGAFTIRYLRLRWRANR